MTDWIQQCPPIVRKQLERLTNEGVNEVVAEVSQRFAWMEHTRATDEQRHEMQVFMAERAINKSVEWAELCGAGRAVTGSSPLGQFEPSAEVTQLAERLREIPLPPTMSATNVETLAMGFAYATSALDSLPIDVANGVLQAAADSRQKSTRLAMDRLGLFGSKNAIRCGWGEWARDWLRCSFARLEIGHRLAAALALTDVPADVTVRAPWHAWSLVVPNGMIRSQTCDIARVWLRDLTPVSLVDVRGELGMFGMTFEKDWRAKPEGLLLSNLVRGACLALSNPEDFRKEKEHGPSQRAKSKNGRSGPPDLQQARFMLSAPVKVDLREHVAAALTGKSHASPTVQFLVRGHWRNQTHGPKHSLRKTIWIQPFWKGPEESRILLRQHRVEEPSP